MLHCRSTDKIYNQEEWLWWAEKNLRFNGTATVNIFFDIELAKRAHLKQTLGLKSKCTVSPGYTGQTILTWPWGKNRSNLKGMD